ncbi:hypothetical protein EJ04DRAFT_511575 [Polyplosphaeria fusca]|uniref:Uncharacterized protein n=1 Tax=Polyplosphaeria fusca TaxID=682080 RepID=A0A9P4R3I6_9PLEO|nr:hypothetical protein EJ04DRAFT_511575 [Polyplosphaeria fusca]
MTDKINGEGLLYVKARISRKDILDEPGYMKWYDEDHIAEIIETSGVDNAFRYKDVEQGKPTCPYPYLAFYPMKEMAFTLGEEFRKIRVKSDLLPGSGICYDVADNEVRYLKLTGKTEAPKKKEPAAYLVVSAIEPTEGTPDDEMNKLYDQHTEIVSKAPNYLRTLRFRLVYARTNAQSRKLKGLPPTSDEPEPDPPTWQAIHEFAAEPESAVKQALASTPSEVLKRAKQTELTVYKLAKVHGGGKFFD